MKKILLCMALAAAGILYASASHAQETAQIEEKENQKIAINADYYFKYSFSEKPKMGLSVIKISVFDKDGNKTDRFEILGVYDMPRMRGHHSSGPVKFKKNKSGDYLMPLNSVMRGKWEILLAFGENSKNIFTGAIYIYI